MKNEILNKIRKTKEKWQKIQREAWGNPAAENELIHLKLEVQIMEAQALKELEKLEKKIKGTAEDDLAHLDNIISNYKQMCKIGKVIKNGTRTTG